MESESYNGLMEFVKISFPLLRYSLYSIFSPESRVITIHKEF